MFQFTVDWSTRRLCGTGTKAAGFAKHPSFYDRNLLGYRGALTSLGH